MGQVSANFLVEMSLALSTKLGDGSTYDTLLHGKALLVIAASDADDLFSNDLLAIFVQETENSIPWVFIVRNPSIHHPSCRLALHCPCASP